MFNPVAPYRYQFPNLYLYLADIANPDLFGCGSQTWISLDITRFYEEHCQPSSGSAWLACPKNGNRPPFLGAGVVDTICTEFVRPHRCDSSTACRQCRLEPVYKCVRICVCSCMSVSVYLLISTCV